MSTRLQVVMPEPELDGYRAAASAEGLSLAAWVRRALRAALRGRSDGDMDDKLTAIRSAAAHTFPAPDIEQMLEEIEQGYRGGLPG